MGRQKLPDRVVGVYDEPGGKRWRLVFVTDGERDYRFFETKEEAETASSALKKKFALTQRTVGQALDEYLVHKARGMGEKSLRALRVSLRVMLTADVETDPLVSITAARCRELYLAAVDAKYAAATHHKALSSVKEFLLWCVEKRWLSSSPAVGLSPLGEPSRGKEQLRIHEARAWLAKGLAFLDAGEWRYLTAITCLLLAQRVSQLLACQVKDLDAEGTVLWVVVKKKRGVQRERRHVTVPDVLAPYLLRYAKDRPPEDLLLPQQARQTVYNWVQKLCKEAGVTRVCTHSLRGLHATLAREAGATGQLVAAQLQHEGVGMQERHYLRPGTKEEAQRQHGLQVLLGGKR